jgi:hypothetical protein
MSKTPKLDALRADRGFPASLNQLRGKGDVLAVLDALIETYERKKMLADSLAHSALRENIERLWPET